VNTGKGKNRPEGVLSFNLFLDAFKVNINGDGRALIVVVKRRR
jgi:hypothetical protein